MGSVPMHKKLIITIAVAALVVSASLVFLGIRLGQGGAVNDERLTQKIRQEIAAQLRDEKLMDPLVAAAIIRFAERQRQAQSTAASERAKRVRPVSKTRDHIYGDPDAELSLIEYSDFECPYCKRFHPTAKKIVAAYGGKVNWVYRHFPLAFHNPGAQKEAEASECAAELGGNDAFWRYADRIYERTKSNGKGFPLDRLIPLAKEIGLNGKRFKACLDGGKTASRVNEDVAEGNKIGIDGTPGNILRNNRTGEVRLKAGARPFDMFKREIDEMLR